MKEKVLFGGQKYNNPYFTSVNKAIMPPYCTCTYGGGWVRRRCPVAFVIAPRASSSLIFLLSFFSLSQEDDTK